MGHSLKYPPCYRARRSRHWQVYHGLTSVANINRRYAAAGPTPQRGKICQPFGASAPGPQSQKTPKPQRGGIEAKNDAGTRQKANLEALVESSELLI